MGTSNITFQKETAMIVAISGLVFGALLIGFLFIAPVPSIQQVVDGFKHAFKW